MRTFYRRGLAILALLVVAGQVSAACVMDPGGWPEGGTFTTQSEALNQCVTMGEACSPFVRDFSGIEGELVFQECRINTSQNHYAIIWDRYNTTSGAWIREHSSSIHNWANSCDDDFTMTGKGTAAGGVKCVDGCEMEKATDNGWSVCFEGLDGTTACDYKATGDQCAVDDIDFLPDGCAVNASGDISCISNDPPNCGEFNGKLVCAGPPDVPNGCGSINGEIVCPGDNNCGYVNGVYVCAGSPPPDDPPELPPPPEGPPDNVPDIIINHNDNDYSYEFHNGGEGPGAEPPPEPPPVEPPPSPEPPPDPDMSDDTDGDDVPDTAGGGGPACGGNGQPACGNDPPGGGGVACGGTNMPPCPDDSNEGSGACGGDGQPPCGFCGGPGQPSCGEPWDPGPENTPPECGFDGQPACPEPGESFCGGDGQPSCYDCGGDGQPACFTCGGPNQPPCATCGGDGQPPCWECGGPGQPECGECGSPGMPPCNECGGDGQPLCGECGGIGQPDCETCGIDGLPPCNSCGGPGEPECVECGDPGMPECSTCGGDGQPECGEGEFRGGNCSQTPTCSGDAILCQIAINTWQSNCGHSRNLNEFIAQSPSNPLDPGAAGTIDMASAISDAEFALPAVCPAPYTLTVWGAALEWKFEPFCELAGMMRYLIIALAYLMALKIVVRGR